MKSALALISLVVPLAMLSLEAPTGVVSRSGDLSVVLHWDAVTDSTLAGYRAYRAVSVEGPFSLQHTGLLTTPGYCDLTVINDQTNYYQVTAVASDSQESVPSATVAVAARAFADDDEFLEYIQQTSFDYFWYGANPVNGLVPDRLPTPAPNSIAAVGFGLTAIGIGVDHGWISRAQGIDRVRTTLRTFLDGPQGTETSGTTGYKGWFYHFLDMKTGLRYMPFNSELSSIDTALLLGGVLYAKEYFDAAIESETEIRELADALFARVDWNWMARGGDVLSMGWRPESGFLSAEWIGYNEAMILYILGLGAPANPLPASAWNRWTSGYAWGSHYGLSYVPFGPLFGHQYSHCWIDFRHIADDYMNSRNSTYFLNSRSATIAQRSYAIANPLARIGYSSNVWGLTACDGPNGYAARGAPPAENDDGTIAPTAAGGSIAFAPEYCVPALRHFYTRFRRSVWTAYGFRDAFNQGAQWWAPDNIGIDQGPFVLMIENYRTGKVWQRFMRNSTIRAGLERAGFIRLSFMNPTLDGPIAENAMSLTWDSLASHYYQVEYSPDLATWFGSPTLELAEGPLTSWIDTGPPLTRSAPLDAGERFYRVFQLGSP